MNTKSICITACLGVASGAFIYHVGFRYPPSTLRASDLPSIYSASTYSAYTGRSAEAELAEADIENWNTLEFDIAGSRYPGETPDFIIDLNHSNGNRSIAIYNRHSEDVFFIFPSEADYGIFTEPSPGGWAKPMYVAPKSEELLRLLRVEDQI